MAVVSVRMCKNKGKQEKETVLRAGRVRLEEQEQEEQEEEEEEWRSGGVGAEKE